MKTLQDAALSHGSFSSASSKQNRKRGIALACSLAIVVMEIVSACMSWSEHGVRMFTFYTEDSNLLALAACGVYSYFLIREIAKGREIPVWATMFKYIGTCCLMLTFLVVVCILAPMLGGARGYQAMLLENSMLYHHLICPLVALASCLFADADPLPVKRAALYAMVPTLVYAAVIIVLNICRALSGPYPFLMVYRQPWWASVLWCVGIIGFAYVIALALAALRGRTHSGKQAKKPASGTAY
ncbi:MAG: hypothetical protein LKE53_03010 [Oscillospiraceae bacterium]|jgi:hypothetical protein|nr:hypothetical protein [Oscillospiraceae bacterium]MDD3262048.1 hypothetical protein [Oscillospiraceae bacterium]